MTWPLHRLTLTTPELTLRAMTEAEALALQEAFPDDVGTDPALPQTGYPVLQTYWRAMGRWSAADWELPLTVLHEDKPIGIQALEGKDFPVLRTVDTWSWLVPGERGQGWGRQMRTAVLSLAFGPLGAQRAVSSALAENAASIAVSRALGYQDNGIEPTRRPDGSAGMLTRFVLDADDWQPPAPVTITGTDGCLPLFGL